MHQILDTQLNQLQHRVGQVTPQDLRVSLLLQLVDEVLLGVEPEALSGSRPSSSTSSLLSTSLRDRADEQRLDSDPGVVDLLLEESRVDDVDDSVDGEGGFGDVGGDDDLPSWSSSGDGRWRCWVEDSLLLIGRK